MEVSSNFNNDYIAVVAEEDGVRSEEHTSELQSPQ